MDRCYLNYHREFEDHSKARETLEIILMKSVSLREIKKVIFQFNKHNNQENIIVNMSFTLVACTKNNLD